MKLKTGIQLVLFIATIFLVQACNKQKVMRVDLQAGFDQDTVTIDVNDILIFNKVVTTNTNWNLAEIKNGQYDPGEYRVRVIVNFMVMDTIHISLQEDTYVLANYNSVANSLNLVETSTAPVY